MEFKAKLLDETRENDKKHKFGPFFAPFDPYLRRLILLVTFTSISS